MKDSLGRFLVFAIFLGAAYYEFIYKPAKQEMELAAKLHEEQTKKVARQKSDLIRLYYDAKRQADDHINNFLYSNIKLVDVHCGAFDRYFTLSLKAPVSSSIEAMIIGITIEDKLGQEIFKGDLRSMERIPAGKTIHLSWEISWETSRLCNHRVSQLVAHVSKPFGRFKAYHNKWDKAPRDTPAIVRFSGGTIINEPDFELPHRPDETWSVEQIKEESRKANNYKALVLSRLKL